MSGCQPLTIHRLPRAALTMLLAMTWSAVSRGAPGDERRRRRRQAGSIVAAYVVILTLAVLVGGFNTIVWIALGALPAAVVGCYIACVVLLLQVVNKLDRWAWIDGSATLLATARQAAPGTLDVSNLAGWPVGRGRAKPFLADLCRLADRQNWTLTGVAGDRYLLKALYTPLGFVTTDGPDVKRPTIRRDPGSPITI